MRRLAFKMCLIFGLLAPAAAQAGGYISGGLGVTLPTASDLSSGADQGELAYEPGFMITLGLGYALRPTHWLSLRTEAEFGFQQSNFDEATLPGEDGEPVTRSLGGQVTLLSGMANATLGVPIARFEPYVLLGAGIVAIEFAGDEGEGEDSATDATRQDVFAYQGGAGLAYRITPRISVDGSYRYLTTTDVDLGGFDASFESHNSLVSVRAAF